MNQKKILIALATVAAIGLNSAVSSADILERGGHTERFRAGGDQTPPLCQFDVPRATQSAFKVTWNCTDDVSSPDELRSELWLQRHGQTVPSKVADFLGFPAGLDIDEAFLGVSSVADAMPLHFRLLVRDRAGVSVITPFVTVSAQDNSVDNCTLGIVTESTESSGGTTGIPALTTTLTNGSVVTTQVTSSDVRIATSSAQTAGTCEIESVCSNGSQVSFTTSLTIDSSGATTGSVSISPGSVLADLTGTSTVESSILTSLDLAGTTMIDGVAAAVTLNCSQ